jgi:hypothetical protein
MFINFHAINGTGDEFRPTIYVNKSIGRREKFLFEFVVGDRDEYAMTLWYAPRKNYLVIPCS